MVLAPFYLESGGSHILCTLFSPSKPPANGCAAVLIVPPWAEEMNKSRRMLALLGAGLAKVGITAALPDLYGTGDSAGDFVDARWEIWRRNLFDVVVWLRDYAGCESLVLLGERTGALLACDVLHDLPLQPRGILFWQPVVNGQQFLTQFLRLRLAASIQNPKGQRETPASLRERLKAGDAVEVAGYDLAPELAAAVEGLDLSALIPASDLRVRWFELGPDPARLPFPASRVAIEHLQRRGADVAFEGLVGDAFWATQEIAEILHLIDTSCERIQELFA